MSVLTPRIIGRTLLKDRGIIQSFSKCSYQTVTAESSKRNVNATIDQTEILINPLDHPDFFHVHNLFTVKDLFEARVHYGHKDSLLNPHMKPFIYGSRLGQLIIDLDQTADLLRRALNFVAHIAFREGIILFISRNPQTTFLVDRTAEECREFSHTRNWDIGTFTNSALTFRIESRLPDVCIFLSTLDAAQNEHLAVTDSAKLFIPTIGIVDTNSDPRLISYPVPGNDDSVCSIKLYCQLFKQAILRGKAARDKLSAVQNESISQI